MLGAIFGFAAKHWLLTGVAGTSAYAYRDEISEQASETLEGIKRDGIAKTATNVANSAAELMDGAAEGIGNAKNGAENLVNGAIDQMDKLKQLQEDITDLKKVKDDPAGWLSKVFSSTNESGESELDLTKVFGATAAGGGGLWLLKKLFGGNNNEESGGFGFSGMVIMAAVAFGLYKYKDEIENVITGDDNKPQAPSNYLAEFTP